jgi:hypothetical protein
MPQVVSPSAGVMIDSSHAERVAWHILLCYRVESTATGP